MNKKSSRKLSAERDKKTVIIVERILKELGKQKVYQYENRQGYVDCYNELVKKTLDIFVDEDLKLADINYVFGTLEGIIQHLTNYTKETLNKHDRVMNEFYYGKGYDEITVSDLDKKLKRLEG